MRRCKLHSVTLCLHNSSIMPELHFDLNLIPETSPSAACVVTIKKTAIFAITSELQMVKRCSEGASQEQAFLCFSKLWMNYL